MPADEERRLAALVRAHDRWRGREVFNLLPSENAVSPTARRYLSSDLAGRYTLPMTSEFDGETLDNSYAGTRYTDEVEQIANAAAARVFRARFATTRPLSGHIAALSALVPLLPPKSRLLAIQPDEGGYDGYAPGFIPATFGYTVRPLPATGPGHRVRLEEAVDAIRRERPNAVVLGQSFFLFPYPLKEIAEEAHARDALVFYDGSHVLGLIAGGVFQDPIRDGADVLYGSTHKSFPGPQGGLLVTDREDLFQQIDPALRSLLRLRERRGLDHLVPLDPEQHLRGGPHARIILDQQHAASRGPPRMHARGFAGGTGGCAFQSRSDPLCHHRRQVPKLRIRVDL
jgi:glycine hydroxymethyltransferase